MEPQLDLQHPLTVYQDLHYDVVLSLFANESDHMPHLLSFHPSDSRFSIRRTALSLIAQAKFSYGLDPFLVYLSVNYVDRFLSKQEILDTRPWIPHILVVASLSLAAKMRNSNSSLLHTVLQREGDFVFDAQSVQRMEKIILALLQWRMRSITPFSFLQYFLSLLNIQDSTLSQSLNTRASDIIFNVQHGNSIYVPLSYVKCVISLPFSDADLKLLEHKPSIIAASALLSAIQDLDPLTFPSSKTTISSCEFVNRDALLECVDMMMPAITEGSPSIPRSEVAATSSGFPETNNVKRRRPNGFCDNRTFQISQIQQC